MSKTSSDSDSDSEISIRNEIKAKPDQKRGGI